MNTMTEQKYHPQAIEQAAQQHWTASNAYTAIENDPRFPKGKFYACSMLPYPSGKLHMGHVRNYTIGDVMYRALRMQGYNVLSPMGWDAFGMPAENAAIANKVPPAQWTYANIADMKSQMQPLGLAFDWSRELATCKPEYYKWNQWFFLKMLEKGIAYRKTQIVNWDPVDQTVLANEQVIDGRGWRSGALVEKREIPGYYLAITQYADELLDTVVSKLDGWPERVRLMQENWIGKSVGVRFAFTHDIKGAYGKLIGDGRMYVFTTRADTIMGVTFCAVAPEHPLAEHAAKSDAKVAAFIEECKKGGTTEAELALQEKKGVNTDLKVTHPLTGEKVDVWVGNYVLMAYGDGAVMGVPAHDERDFAFAKKYGIAIKSVIKSQAQMALEEAIANGVALGSDPLKTKDKLNADVSESFKIALSKYITPTEWIEDFGRKDGVCVNSGKYNGKAFKDAVDAVAADFASKSLGEKKTTWRLRDWGISRQRYWGTPIPIIHCDEHGAVPVPEKDLPVVLPEDCIPDGSGNPLNKHVAFHAGVTCPTCGKPARRETDTMDTFVDSAWYYMRYACPGADGSMVDARNDYWMPMDQYIGGIEHAVLHLLYARFWTKVMRDMGLVKFDEPFTKLFTQGMLNNESFYREEAEGKKHWFYPSEVTLQHDDKGKPIAATLKADGKPVMLGGIEKMSKSKNNVVEPKDIIAQYGADTARLFSMFAAPPDQGAVWSDSGVQGAFRFLNRLWAYAHANASVVSSAHALTSISDTAKKLRREVHVILKQAQYDYERLQYNTVVSACMKLFNALEDAKLERNAGNDAVMSECMSLLLRTLYPIVPHITHALWTQLGFKGEILDAPWPQVDEAALVQNEIELMLQINGKLRGSIVMPASADKAAIEAAALATEAFVKLGTAAKKVVIVPGRLVNIVA
jgi:leucyl-tRNA synthetase